MDKDNKLRVLVMAELMALQIRIEMAETEQALKQAKLEADGLICGASAAGTITDQETRDLKQNVEQSYNKRSNEL